MEEIWLTSWHGGYPIIHRVFLHPRWLFGISEPSTVSTVISNRINQDVCNLGANWGAPPSPRPPLLGGNQVGDAGHLERTSPKDQVLGCQGSKRCIATVGMWCCDLWIALEPHLLENTCTPRVDSPPRRIFTNVSKWNLMNKVLKYL